MKHGGEIDGKYRVCSWLETMSRASIPVCIGMSLCLKKKIDAALRCICRKAASSKRKQQDLDSYTACKASLSSDFYYSNAFKS